MNEKNNNEKPPLYKLVLYDQKGKLEKVLIGEVVKQLPLSIDFKTRNNIYSFSRSIPYVLQEVSREKYDSPKEVQK